MKHLQKKNWSSVAVILSCLLILFVGFFLILFGHDKPFSEQENRSLRGRPRLSAKAFLTGELADAADGYFCDQFPARDAMIGLRGAFEILLGRGENNGILLGKGGCLARRRGSVLLSNGSTVSGSDGVDPAQISSACEGIRRAAASLGERFTVMLTGRNADVMSSAFAYPNEFGAALEAQLRQELDGVRTVETVSLLRERFASGEDVWFRTDHHWTARGAYLAYCELMRSWGREREILPGERFERRRVSDSFRGSLWSAGGMKWVKPDSVELWLTGNEASYEVTADGRPAALYDLSRTKEKDCYSVFLGGVHDVITLRRAGEERPTLLLLKDSFANSLAPFLAEHFDLVLLNLSSPSRDFTDLTRLAEEWEADEILLVYTFENLLSADKLPRLR